MQSRKLTIRNHLVNDESELQTESLDALKTPEMVNLKRNYHVVSIIGSQSSGKSTLLNELFNTSFEVLDKRKRVGQTTKGIWFSVDAENKMFIFDVEGSDSNERMDTRTKTERSNSLFALATSNTLLVNIWTQQLGLFRGSQLAILQVVLELNLKLFKSEQPKEIVFVVRDFEKENENPDNLSKTIYKKVKDVWDKIAKPPGTENIQLDDLFHLNTYFLPSFLEEKEEFRAELAKLRTFLFELSSNPKLTKSNVLVEDFPQFLENVWKTIQDEKDLNLPAEKVLIANLRCNQIKDESYRAIEEPLGEVLFKAENTINKNFGRIVSSLINRAIQQYNKQTENYPADIVSKISEQFLRQLEMKIQNIYRIQVSKLTEELAKEVMGKFAHVNSQESKGKGIRSIEDQAYQSFAKDLQGIAYKKQWIAPAIQQFKKQLRHTIESGKEKIVIDFKRQLDALLRKKIDTLVSRLLEDKEMYDEGRFWDELQTEYQKITESSNNNIRNKFKQLDYSKNIDEYIDRNRQFCVEQLKSKVISQVKNLNHYLIRHFKNDFNFDEKKVPRNWPLMTEEDIKKIYKEKKDQYVKAINNFENFKVKQSAGYRGSMMESANDYDEETVKKSLEEGLFKGDHVLSLTESQAIKKRFEQDCQSELNEALRKQSDQYTGRIPKWMFGLIALFMIDDILVWIRSPYIIVPFVLIVLLLIAASSMSKGTLLEPIVNQVKQQATSTITGLLKPKAGPATQEKKDS